MYELAIQFYKMMSRDGVVCDIVIFNTLINVYSQKKLSNKIK
jgi:hypothetical protein